MVLSMISPTWCIWIGLIVRIAVAIWNSFFGPSLGADLDAHTFHIKASEISKNLTFDHLGIGWIYVQFLGLFYFFIADSLFIGCLLSCITWFFSAYILLGSMQLLSISRSAQSKALLIYSLLPSSILFTAVTLREPFQLFFINLQVYALLKIFFHASNRYWMLLIIAAVGASILHGALFAFSLVLVMLAVIIGITIKLNFSKIGITFLCTFSLIFFISISSIFGELTTYRLESGIGKAIQLFNEKSLLIDARTRYKSDVTIESIWDLGLFTIISIFQYVFEPFPWKISSVQDFFCAIEGVLRGYLIFKASSIILRHRDTNQKFLFLILFLYFTLTAIFAIGSTNWGTAARHHVPSLGLLLLASYGTTESRKNLRQSAQQFILKKSQRKL